MISDEKNSFAVSGIKKNKKTVITLLFISVLLLFNIQLKLNIYLNLFLVLLVAATAYFSYKVLFEKAN
jgi:hypothetical protein